MVTDQIKQLLAEVSELEKKCREALRYDSVFEFVQTHRKVFDKLCAFLDFIGDSQSALHSVSSSDQREKLESYFLAYGLLQLMYSRQISVRELLRDFSIAVPKSLLENSIIAPRDRTIGHPVTSNGKAHVILRNTLDNDGFEYATYDGSLTQRGNFVSYEPLLIEHLSVMRGSLMLLHKELASIENTRRVLMRQEPLSPLLQGMPYCARCVAASLVEEKYGEVFDTNSEALIIALEKFRDGLAKRHGTDSAAITVGSAIEGVKMLQELFQQQDERNNNRYEIVSGGMESKVKALVALALEIDSSEKQDLG